MSDSLHAERKQTPRKQTPNILGEILTGSMDVPVVIPTSQPPIRPKTKKAAPPASRQVPEHKKDAPVPKTWQVRVVSCQNYHGWRPRFIDGVELADWTSQPLLQDYANQQGADGWELAAAAGGQALYGSLDTYQVFFKKAIV